MVNLFIFSYKFYIHLIWSNNVGLINKKINIFLISITWKLINSNLYFLYQSTFNSLESKLFKVNNSQLTVLYSIETSGLLKY